MRSDNILEAIGHTPLVEIAKMSPKKEVRIFVKLEGQNVGGSASVKDRIAKYMIEKAEESGELTSNKTILEATSGNTGIALAMVGKRKGYKVKIVMPESATLERRELLSLYGAEIVLTDGSKGVNYSVEVANEMANKDRSYFMPDQFANPLNPQTHYETTGLEILQDLADLKIDVFVAGLGTGGTMMGVGKRLRERDPDVKLIGVEPYSTESIDGLRCLTRGYIPTVLDVNYLDERALTTREEATRAMRELLQKEGIFAGVSSGAVVHHAVRWARQLKKGVVVALLADAGWKYLSMGIETWTRNQEKK